MTTHTITEPPAASALEESLANCDVAALRARYLAQGEFVTVERFLSPELLARLLEELALVAPRVHRNFIPGYKKGGSISRYDLDALAPSFGALYRDAALRRFLEAVTGQELLECPPADPHGYALYLYTEPGDHIGFHYDTSYYRGARYTVLLGLVDESSARLRYVLHRGEPGREPDAGEIALDPGRLVLFNGDKLWHCITPLGAGERRVALTFEYLTDTGMHPLRRFVSNMKDAVAYFGFRQVFGRR